jgi:hypothetical protein
VSLLFQFGLVRGYFGMNTLGAVFLMVGLTLGGRAAVAKTDCSLATLQGSYAVHGQGWTGTAAPFSPVSVTGIRSFDGSGNFTGTGYEVGGGTAQATSTVGTYVVARDCTLTINFTNTPGPANQTQYGVLTNDGNAVYVTRLDSGYTISLTYNRVTPR